MEKYVKVLELMKTKPNGRIEVDDPALVALLGKVHYRLPTYISFIRKYAKLDVHAIRGVNTTNEAGETVVNNRKVTAYELVAVALTADAAVSTT